MNELAFQHKLTALLGDLQYLLPEAVIIVASILLLLTQLVLPKNGHLIKTGLSIGFLFVVAFAVIGFTSEGWMMENMLLHDGLTVVSKLFLIAVMVFILLYPNHRNLLQKGEYHFLLFMVLLGAFVVIQAGNLLFFYVGLELISLSSYVLITFSFKKKGYEAGIKYLLFGALASGLMLYGITLMYGMTGSLDIQELASVISFQPNGLWMKLAVTLFFVGLLFKLALAPFHIWTPDVYEAATSDIVAVISIVPKAATLMFFVHFIQAADLHALALNWQGMLAILAMMSMTIGNLSALNQNNTKRMMGYSSIAHAGVLLIGIITGSSLGTTALVFYVLVFSIMNVGVFYFTGLMEKNGVFNSSDLAGLGRKYPLVGVSVLVIMIALVGLPPTAGFSAKYFVFTALWQDFSINNNPYLLWLFIVGILNAAISLFYYLKIPYYMFVKEQEENSTFQISWKDSGYLAFVALLLLLLFFKGDLLVGA